MKAAWSMEKVMLGADMDMDASGSEQGVAQNESSAEEETVFDMEHKSLLMTEG